MTHTTQGWYAAYTMPKFEKKIYVELMKRNVETYLPIQQVFRQWSDRVKKIEVPLFPNYIFIRNHPRNADRAIQTKGILKFVTFDGRPATISEDNIAVIRKLEAEELEVEPYLVEGTAVRIIRGPLAGFQGKLFSKKGKSRFGVHVDTIGQSLSLEVPAQYLERV